MNLELTQLELTIELTKIFFCFVGLMSNIIMLLVSEKRISEFYFCGFCKNIIQNTKREEMIFANRHTFCLGITAWLTVLIALIYWTASKINAVPANADFGVLFALFLFSAKDIRGAVCTYRNIKGLLYIRKKDIDIKVCSCNHCFLRKLFPELFEKGIEDENKDI